MTKNTSLVLFFLGSMCFAQQYKITYKSFDKGKILDNAPCIVTINGKNESLITNSKTLEAKKSEPFEKVWVDHQDNKVYYYTFLKNGKKISTVDSLIIKNQSFSITNETKKILGYTCKKATTSVNSNNIEVWYTNDLTIKGAPGLLGQNLGLVLEVIRNGDYKIMADKIELQNKNVVSQNEFTDYQPVDLLTYKDEIWKSYFTTVEIFKNQSINFNGEKSSDPDVMSYASGTIILKKVKFPEIKVSDQVFLQLDEKSLGDAYDRTGSVFIIPTDKKISFLNALQSGIDKVPVYDNNNGNDKKYQGIISSDEYTTPIELMRFFTPFGVGKFNTLKLKNKIWEDKVSYRQDISNLSPVFSDREVYIGTYIGNYDKNGHQINLDITIHKGDNNIKYQPYVLPLFNTVNVMEMAGQNYATLFNKPKGLKMNFHLDKNVKNAKLRYITTGHGGWENGDEFVQKKNTIYLNGKEIFAFIPWRQDCGSYRLYNPASGNFGNGLSSSDYSRSNWCPGTLTNPYYIDLGDLSAGNYTLEVDIPQGKPEGNSFSYWNISGVIIGEAQ